ncbi:MAG TPA: M48 family metalloprotease [Steroidobacteraceae bacterium]|nr:M48 family metalloprotease [Steroidobacteraceae bacterium]HNS27176.1 M48 family metalloprotease [Steroidobacteraceae bacterium]
MRQVFTLMLCCALTATAVAQSGSDLPDMGNPVDAILTQGDEYRIGLTVLRQLREQGQVLEDPEISEYIQALGTRIAAQATDEGQRFTFFVIRDTAINAFALPGGFIGVNQGLLLATKNESELASVLAHEIAHVTQRHIARSIRAAGRQSLATTAMVIAGILLGAMGGGDAAQAAIAVAQGSAAQQQINYTRSNEHEADRIGISFLASAGFDPHAMPAFFETMQRRSGLSRLDIPEFILTHPVTSTRIAESRDRAESYPSPKPNPEVSYQVARERARVLVAPDDAGLERYYAGELAAGRDGVAERYGAALADLGNGNAGDAVAALSTLRSAHEGNPMIASSLGQAQMAAGATEAALATFAEALRLSPRNVPLTIRYAEALMRVDRAREAHVMLLDLFNNVAPTPEQIRLTALAASAAGDTGDAYFYMSEYHIANGDLPLSVQQLELALAAPDLSGVQRQRFQARMDEVREAIDRGRKRGRS